MPLPEPETSKSLNTTFVQKEGSWYCTKCHKDFDPFAGPHYCKEPPEATLVDVQLHPPTIDRVLKSSHETFDAVKDVGMRVHAVEGELRGLGGVLEEIYKLLKITSNTPGSDVIDRLDRIEQRLASIELRARRKKKRSLFEKFFG